MTGSQFVSSAEAKDSYLKASMDFMVAKAGTSSFIESKAKLIQCVENNPSVTNREMFDKYISKFDTSSVPNAASNNKPVFKA